MTSIYCSICIKNFPIAIEVELEEGLELAGNLSVQHIIGEKGTSSLEVYILDVNLKRKAHIAASEQLDGRQVKLINHF
jgi:hypothetical protein